jgi:hypothetical protein
MVYLVIAPPIAPVVTNNKSIISFPVLVDARDSDVAGDIIGKESIQIQILLWN